MSLFGNPGDGNIPVRHVNPTLDAADDELTAVTSAAAALPDPKVDGRKQDDEEEEEEEEDEEGGGEDGTEDEDSSEDDEDGEEEADEDEEDGDGKAVVSADGNIQIRPVKSRDASSSTSSQAGRLDDPTFSRYLMRKIFPQRVAAVAANAFTAAMGIGRKVKKSTSSFIWHLSAIAFLTVFPLQITIISLDNSNAMRQQVGPDGIGQAGAPPPLS